MAKIEPAKGIIREASEPKRVVAVLDMRGGAADAALHLTAARAFVGPLVLASGRGVCALAALYAARMPRLLAPDFPRPLPHIRGRLEALFLRHTYIKKMIV
jgi:hypothetical protein